MNNGLPKLKRLCAVHDISGFGKCSLTVALPVVSATGVECACIPTALLSTHTGEFTGWTRRDLTDQMLPMAHGAKTQKLKYGHRGGNQPVKNLGTGRLYITSQKHGYAVLGDSLDKSLGEVSHVNANDGTVEGIRYNNMDCFTVQFHPEACGGPKDTDYLFDEFVDMMKGGC